MWFILHWTLVNPSCELREHANSNSVDLSLGLWLFLAARRFRRLSLLLGGWLTAGQEGTGCAPNTGKESLHNSAQLGDVWGRVAAPETLYGTASVISPSSSKMLSTGGGSTGTSSSASGTSLGGSTTTDSETGLDFSSSSFSSSTSFWNRLRHSGVWYRVLFVHPLHPGISLNFMMRSKVI